jgi:hypothetical protein
VLQKRRGEADLPLCMHTFNSSFCIVLFIDATISRVSKS